MVANAPRLERVKIVGPEPALRSHLNMYQYQLFLSSKHTCLLVISTVPMEPDDGVSRDSDVVGEVNNTVREGGVGNLVSFSVFGRSHCK